MLQPKSLGVLKQTKDDQMRCFSDNTVFALVKRSVNQSELTCVLQSSLRPLPRSNRFEPISNQSLLAKHINTGRGGRTQGIQKPAKDSNANIATELFN